VDRQKSPKETLRLKTGELKIKKASSRTQPKSELGKVWTTLSTIGRGFYRYRRGGPVQAKKGHGKLPVTNGGPNRKKKVEQKG